MTLYEILGVAPTASAAQVKAAWKAKVKATHPDKPGGSQEAFNEVQAAYDILSQPLRRAEYDETGSSDEKRDETDDEAWVEIIKQLNFLLDAHELGIHKMEAILASPLGSMQQGFKNRGAAIADGRRAVETKLATLGRLRRSVRARKDGSKAGRVLHHIFSEQEAAITRSLDQMTKDKAVNDRALAILAEFEAVNDGQAETLFQQLTGNAASRRIGGPNPFTPPY